MNKKNATPSKRSSTQIHFNSKSFSEHVKAAVQGCWPETLQQLGIPAKQLDGRNHACPACGGTDRFQFTVRGAGAEYGRFACRGLDSQGGDGFALVMHLYGCDFTEAVQLVANVLGIATNGCIKNAHRAIIPMQAKTKAPPKIDRTLKVQALFDSGIPLSQSNSAGKYLTNRGLSWAHLPSEIDSPLRSHDGLDYWYSDGDKPELLGRFPALIANVQKPDNSLAAVHRIYLQSNGNKLALRHPNTGEALGCKKLQAVHDGALSGAACRLYPIGNDGCMALTEGIETALAVHRMTGLPVWACISAGGLKTVVLPDSVREVFIYGDNDTPDHKGRNTGKEAAYQLAARLVGEGRKVKVLLPPLADTDWLDVMNDEINRGKA